MDGPGRLVDAGRLEVVPAHRRRSWVTSARTKPFTPKQGQYLAFIYYYTKMHGQPPAEADFQRFFRVTPPVVHQMIETLAARGFIDREPGNRTFDQAATDAGAVAGSRIEQMVRPTGWVVDMRHYIDEDTGNPPEVIPERLAILFDAIVARVTDRLPDGDGHTNVLCRRSPGRRRCRGDIIARLDRSSGYIVWPCPLCGDHGMIHGWEDTLWSLYLRGLRRLVPVEGRHRADAVLFEVTSVLRWWLIGKILSMVLVGVLTTVGLWWLDVPLALTFGLPAAALTFIPNFGPVLSVVPPALLALADDPTRAAYVVVLYLAIRTVESYAVTPLIQRRTVSMPPALTIMSQLVLSVLVGGIGVAVATPLTAAAMTMIRMLYVEDLLEQDTPAEQATGTTDSRSQIRSPLE